LVRILENARNLNKAALCCEPLKDISNKVSGK
jgi:hypothetical protein